MFHKTGDRIWVLIHTYSNYCILLNEAISWLSDLSELFFSIKWIKYIKKINKTKQKKLIISSGAGEFASMPSSTDQTDLFLMFLINFMEADFSIIKCLNKNIDQWMRKSLLKDIEIRSELNRLIT